MQGKEGGEVEGGRKEEGGRRKEEGGRRKEEGGRCEEVSVVVKVVVSVVVSVWSEFDMRQGGGHQAVSCKQGQRASAQRLDGNAQQPQETGVGSAA
jgi:hypothetical protein